MPSRSETGPLVDTRPQYQLSPDQLSRLTGQLLQDRPPTVPDQYVGYMLNGDDPAANLGRHIEREVFWEKFENDSAQMERIYGDTETVSDLFIVVDQYGCKPVGALRITRKSPSGFVTMRAATEALGLTEAKITEFHHIDDMDGVWDIGTLAVPSEYRDIDNHLISNMLYRGMHARAMHEGIQHYISIIDEGAYSTFSFVGFPFETIAGSRPFDYEGSGRSFAMYGYAPDFAPAVQRTHDQAPAALQPFLELYASRLASGEGIDYRLMFDV